MRAPLVLALLALAGGALFLLAPRPARATVPRLPSSPSSSSPAWVPRMAAGSAPTPPGPWKPPTTAGPYLAAIRAAELAHGLPYMLLARLLYQESRFRPDIISGQVRSSAGAVGIAQIVPAHHPDVNPLDAPASIAYAAKYLASLHRRFGSWEKALASYNWGPTRVARVAGSPSWLNKAPTETRRYVEEITRDVPAAASRSA